MCTRTKICRPIGKTIVSTIERGRSTRRAAIIAVASGVVAGEELQKVEKRLAGLHPAHAAYVRAQNIVSLMCDILVEMRPMDSLLDLIYRAHDEYEPGGPPMSPLTLSYFSCWCFFDACSARSHETLGTIFLDVVTAFGKDAELLRVMRLLQVSRMGIWAVEGTVGNCAVLRELVTGATCHAIVPAGYLGQRGELWYVRVLPPPIAGTTEHVVFVTPYILLRPGQEDWEAYFDRVLPEAPPQARFDAYESHMKYGPTRKYWNEFVFEAYANHRREAVYLVGLPDVPESRPHSEHWRG